MKDWLYELIRELCQVIRESPDESGPVVTLAILIRTMQADAVGIYLKHPGSQRFKLRCKHIGAFTGTLPDDFSMPGDPCARNMIMLTYKNETVGAVSFFWQSTTPYRKIEAADKTELEVIVRLLTDIYYIMPAMDARKEKEASLLALYQKSEDALDKYRRQVSLTLHDEVGQALTAVTLQLNMLEKLDNLEVIKTRIKGLGHIVNETLNEVRKISRNLRPYLLEKLGLQVALQTHIKEYSGATGISVEFLCNDLECSLPPETEEILFRTSQECLTNVARHAEATLAVLTLSIKQKHVLLRITDNGKGFPKKISYGLGLIGMQEQTKFAGGRFWACNENHGGACVNVLVPLEQNGLEA